MAARVTAVRRIQFCAGHRISRHESKCKDLHGHNFVAFFHAESPTGLDPQGRVIDFGVLKERLGAWIDERWDHGMVLWREDHEAVRAVTALPGQKVYLLDANPTAENLALVLLHEAAPAALAGTGVTVTKVVLWETENAFVEVTL
jgi:6-pyruvoyltetrahydropterin/6-carboxytetrahydropterin synthase